MFASLSQKNGFVFVNQIWHFKALNQYYIAQKIWFRMMKDFKTNLQETPIKGESFWRVSRFAQFSQKNSFVFVKQIWHFQALNQYSIAEKIRFRVLTDFKLNSQDTKVQVETFWRVSRYALLCQKNGFVFINQTQDFKALNQYSIAQKIQFRVSTDFKINSLETKVQGETFWRVSMFASLSQKNGFVFVNQIWHS